ncbi:DeoR/GlpR family DNA-binding transcription regulator [Arthrobacter sp. ATA002]|uniref:DeoR/GlpR family DNA-binding transcription regulator n=1 Tax=Arthrobacter sp. ATA002 TaxID=2991715 RepID=UPI0022A7825E|nr:DeoR/GlpR family DNA-binding transcription regulator [Arthrobacter sp. ATA002]WAP51413.1 DeoR/GlpR family DNA-binding transcription regulator [Arthrobacter sp. ATA002]
MLTDSRHAAIVRRVQETGGASVADLARLVAVSESTIRRDLKTLNGRGLLRRVRGGGAGTGSAGADPAAVTPVRRPASKQRIAVRAAALVRDGDVVVLDSGTTTALIARELRGRAVTVITASVAVLDELRDDPATELVLLGGVLRRSCHLLAGSLAEDALRRLRATVCFLGASGVQPDGSVMDATGTEVPAKRAILRAAPHVVLAADETKFPGTGLVPVATAAAFTTLVTSTSSDPQTLGRFRHAGSDVITV